MDETYQFVALDVFQMTVGECHECARGDQGLHHLFVAAISIVGREFGSSGVRTGVSIRHGTPRRRSAACLPEETQISRIGEITPSGPMSTDPDATGSGTVDPTSQGWPTAPASLPEGPGFNDYPNSNNRPWQNQDALRTKDVPIGRTRQSHRPIVPLGAIGSSGPYLAADFVAYSKARCQTYLLHILGANRSVARIWPLNPIVPNCCRDYRRT
jgi:hypothetical protein